MHYQEYNPSAILSQHVECYWEMTLSPGELDSPFEMLAPDCTFDIWFIKTPLSISSVFGSAVRVIQPGAYFIGQKTNCVRLSVEQTTQLFGIRFKPFAFANLIQQPLYQFNDQIIPLDLLFDLNDAEHDLLQTILASEPSTPKADRLEDFVYLLISKAFQIDQTLRAQLNYILDRKGLIQVNHLFKSFSISKVTLRNHFLTKMGLPPKKVSRIWRINYFLQLKKVNPQENLTQLCLEAGFYDQAHFIKEFRQFYGTNPKQFFQQESKLLEISQGIIAKRFTNQYDPKV